MLLKCLAAIFSSALFAQGVIAALTSAQVVTNIGIVTTVSGNLDSTLGGLTTSTSPSAVVTMANTVKTDFQTIIDDLAADVTAMQATPPFPDNEALAIVTALHDFVTVHQLLLATVIGQHGIFAQFGVTAPIAAILRSLEAGIDSFATAMIDLIPTQAPAVQDDQDSLDDSVGNTIDIYDQLCIPSILYPALMPICISL